MTVFEELKRRGLIAQTTNEEEIQKLFDNEPVTFYIGFDATADSLTAGHFLTIMAMMHMQKAGHRPIALLGGGTTMIGDPSGKSDMRNMLTKETIDHNAKRFKEQLSRFITFDDDKAILANNADWLLNLNYVEFLREVGVHFSVNKMLTAECYKQRMERGLTFLEFNYMIMQSYDFYMLYQKQPFGIPAFLWLAAGLCLVLWCNLALQADSAIQPGIVVYFVVLYTVGEERVVFYTLARILDTGIGVLISLLCYLLLPSKYDKEQGLSFRTMWKATKHAFQSYKDKNRLFREDEQKNFGMKNKK